MRSPLGCPACVHSLAGYHVAHPPSASPAQPKARDQNLWCVWCDGWCVRDGVKQVGGSDA